MEFNNFMVGRDDGFRHNSSTSWPENAARIRVQQKQEAFSTKKVLLACCDTTPTYPSINSHEMPLAPLLPTPPYSQYLFGRTLFA